MPVRPFAPIAIVGRSCVLPGALDPESFWSAVREGRDLLSRAPAGRWRVAPSRVHAPAGAKTAVDAAWSDRGGYVAGFEDRFDPTGFQVPEEQIRRLDPLFQWVLHSAREALRDSGRAGERAAESRKGLILGNLSFPSSSLSRFAESVWLESAPEGVARIADPPDPLNRFMSGLPAQLAARALGLGAGSFALDAACASALYAIELACGRLHDGDADLMLAGAVNAADDLFIHVGFTALEALSRTGRSRPFHREADGLVPAEGAAFVALKRLEDAVAAGDPVHGVIRGVGLSNDGRGSGLLAPAERGQRRAMRMAYERAGIAPAAIGLLECHATGTPVGDATEVRSAGAVFEGLEGVPIGSVKSNLGHLITVAGMAGLLKLLGALRDGVRPPTLSSDAPIGALEGSPFRLLRAAEPWRRPDGAARCAALSAFGFGGNNAHLIVEEYRPGTASHVAVPELPRDEIAVVGLGAVAAGAPDADAFASALFSPLSRVRPRPDGQPAAGWVESVELDAAAVRFPPRDLEQALPQQLLVLASAQQAVASLGELPRERTAVLTGMQTDAEVARYGARWRAGEWSPETAGDAWRVAAAGAFASPLRVAGVLGAMPNICANRLNSQFDLGGPSFAVCAEELSGIRGLQIAVRALRAGEIDAALVSAVDVSAEAVHEAAAETVLDPARHPAGDAAVTLVLERRDDARRAGRRVLAVIADDDEPGELQLGLDGDGLSLTPRLGHAHAASGLLHVAAAVAALRHRAHPAEGETPTRPWLPGPAPDAEVRISSHGGESARVVLRRSGHPLPAPGFAAPRLHLYSGSDRGAVRRAVEQGRESRDGPARLAIVAADESEHAARRGRAAALLDDQAGRAAGALGDGIAFFEQPVAGELAFVFSAPGGSYPGMGRELLLGFPELAASLAERFRGLRDAAGWVYDPAAVAPRAVDKLWGSSLLSQVHAGLSRGVLGLRPQAAIGFSSGETNALYGLGAWSDFDAMREEIDAAGIYTRELAGRFDAVRRAWGLALGAEVSWTSWRLLAPVDQVRGAVAREPRVHVTILNAPGDCVISGDAAGCERVVDAIGRERARPLGYDIAVHCPELAEVRDTWRRLHHRATKPVPGVRFYTHATLGHYTPDADAAAEALLGQALGAVDFPALIERAWRDGVRVFVEHGPRDGCSRWIGRILGDRPHVAAPLDVAGRSSLHQAANALALLAASGQPVDLAALARATPDPSATVPARPLRFPVQRRPPRLPPLQAAASAMPAAPILPPVLEHARDEALARRPPPPPVAPPSCEPNASRGSGRPAERDAVARLLAEQSHITELHRRYVEQAARMHQRFLATRSWTPPAAAAAADAVVAAPPAVAARAPARSQPPPEPRADSALRFSRADLERLASGPISEVFGPEFREQDDFVRQVRMPEPPLLLADRVTGLKAEPRSMDRGTIFTETDVRPDSWYLHEGHMPAGIMIESGQADLLLISWLGVDFLNRGERVYRLLGCELTYSGGLPAPGDTLCYDIHVDGHARHGDVRLFFFHYDCRIRGGVRLSVRNGQAGFFSDEELRASGGVLWDPESAERSERPRLDPPAVTPGVRAFPAPQVAAFAEGRAADCFGSGFERAATHVRPPRIASGRMLLLQDVLELDPDGGPWGRGYLRAAWRFSPRDWFFDGHFKGDPCMPGTLMLEGCLQAMAFYMAALGDTLARDGWRFEPVPDVSYALRCRGQALPSSRELVYELFVDERIDGPDPTLYADLLCTVDGVKAFHCRRMGLRLVPDFPIGRQGDAPTPTARSGTAAVVRGGLKQDERALLATAWGAPSAALGPRYRRFDGALRLARLPGPPYHFLSRVIHLDGEIGEAKPGASVEIEYDVPGREAWYFDGDGRMPLSVLLEAALQPCGWLALASGAPLKESEPLSFRNLDGTLSVTRELPPGAGTLLTRSRLTSVSRTAGMILLSFDVDCSLATEPVLNLTTSFGFFPAAALARQVGVPTTDADRERLAVPGTGLDLRDLLEQAPPSLVVANRDLLMLDRVTGWWPEGGDAGLGRLRAEKDVVPGEWFFKAHFFQDPVQPGSLGLEALLQLLRVYALERGLGAGLERPRFEPLALGEPFSWKYRGQVLPTNRRVTLELEVTELRRESGATLVRARGWLWVDGTRVYSATGLTARIVEQD